MRLEIAPAALTDLDDGAAFYEGRGGIELRLRFVAEFDRIAQLILAHPDMGKATLANRRRYLMRRFPYSIIYQVTSDTVRVVAAAHQSRRPAYRAGRT